MSVTTEILSADELSILENGVQERKAAAPREGNLLVDMGIFIAHLAFWPMVGFALIPNASMELLDIERLYMFPVALVVALIVIHTRLNLDRGDYETRKLPYWGVILMSLSVVLVAPFALVFIGMTLLTTAVGGLEVLMFIWPGVALSAFLFWYIKHGDR